MWKVESADSADKCGRWTAGMKSGAKVRVKVGVLLGFLLSTFNFQPSTSFAKDISVTQVKVMGNEAEVEINNVLTVREIKVNREGALSLKFPETVSKSGRVYPQITLTSKQADEAVRKAISTEKIEGPIVEWDLAKDLKLKDLRRHPRKKGQYFAMISFGEAIEVSCQFVKQGETVKVRWPARPPENQGGKWSNQVYFKKKEIRSAAESALTPQFLAKENELFPAGSSGSYKKPAKKMSVEDDE